MICFCFCGVILFNSCCFSRINFNTSDLNTGAVVAVACDGDADDVDDVDDVDDSDSNADNAAFVDLM